ncbi:MAG TPA: response regulator transcription factor [Caulobacteraceae bacterium]|nr:response regulator transcription factor [Caulobacteraceae bacterium]
MRILIVDDHAIVRTGLRRFLAMAPDVEIHEAATGRECLAAVKSQALDLLIVDLNLPELGGLELLARLQQIGSPPILVLSMHAEPLYVTRALEAGARGYVTKNAAPEEVLTAIRRVGSGGRYVETEIAQLLLVSPLPATTFDSLSARDIEILRHLTAGKSLGQIAAALGLGYKTIANNCTLIKAKLGVSRTADLLRVALESGLL